MYRLQQFILQLKTKHPSGKLAHWGEVVSEFDLEVKYRPGCKNANADALSQSPTSQSELEDDDEAFHSVQVGAVVLDVTVKGLQKRMRNW